MSTLLLGIDIGGTKCGVCLGTDDGSIVAKESFLTNEPLGPEQTIECLLATTRSMLVKEGVRPAAVGIACGSPLDPDRGIIQAPPNLPSWKDVPIVDVFRNELDIPVFLDNDANAGACAEYVFGAGKGSRHMVFLTFGTGMGAGIIANGDIYRGANCYAGEVGHLRLAPKGPIGYHKAGSFEGFCSGGGIAQLASSMRADWTRTTVLTEAPDAREVGEAAAAGDELALDIMEASGSHLGRGLAIILDVLNPEIVVIGSIFARCEALLRPAMERSLAEEALAQTVEACRIVPASLGEKIGDYAALSVAALKLRRNAV